MLHNEPRFTQGLRQKVNGEYSAVKKPFQCSAKGNLCLENKQSLIVYQSQILNVVHCSPVQEGSARESLSGLKADIRHLLSPIRYVY